MIETTIQADHTGSTIQGVQIEAYIEGYEERIIEIRGYGLTTDERHEVEQRAHELYA